MRILQIIQKKQYRGAEIFASQLSNQLINQGHVVEIVSIYDGDALLPFNDKIVNLSSINSNRYIDVAGWKKLNEIILQFKPDIVQANAADTLKYAIFSKLFYNWKQPIFYRNASTSSFYIKSHYSKFLNSFLLKNVTQIISVSNASKNDLNILFPFTKTKSVVIPIGVDIKYVKPFKFKNEKKNIIHVGSFTREKNHLSLLYIFQEILRTHRNCHLNLLGEGPMRKEIEDRAIEMGLSKNISFYEGVQNPLPYISGADVLVLPSIIEGLPAVILEAMYCRTEVVAYDVGGVSEIISDNTGHLIKKNDIIGFANAVSSIFKKTFSSKVENAYELVTSSYMNSNIASDFISIYKKILMRNLSNNV
jgi:L-malate glycosyltransferase